MKLISLLLFLFLAQSTFPQGKFFGGNGDGFATVSITNVILPVRILNFNVYKNGQVNKAELSIESNDAICLLEFQRSIDGSNFLLVDSLKTDYSGATSMDYTFTDAAPADAINYYRVKIIYCDGSFRYSLILSVRGKSHNNQLYFSSADNTIHYSVSENGLLQVVNNLGQLVYKKAIIAGSGNLSLPVLIDGVYFLRFGKEAPVRILVHR